MLGVKITARASRSPKTLVTTDVQAYITLLSSNFNGNSFVLHTKIFMIHSHIKICLLIGVQPGA